jgi:hypothetical protein
VHPNHFLQPKHCFFITIQTNSANQKRWSMEMHPMKHRRYMWNTFLPLEPTVQDSRGDDRTELTRSPSYQ